MSELPPANPNAYVPDYERERTPEEAKRYEARELAALNELLWDLFENRLSLSSVKESTDVAVEASAALDNIASLALSLGRRDPEMALILIEELETGPYAGTDQTISERLRVMHGLPPWNRDASLPPGVPSSSPEHDQ